MRLSAPDTVAVTASPPGGWRPAAKWRSFYRRRGAIASCSRAPEVLGEDGGRGSRRSDAEHLLAVRERMIRPIRSHRPAYRSLTPQDYCQPQRPDGIKKGDGDGGGHAEQGQIARQSPAAPG